jgi:hypothetical protein
VAISLSQKTIGTTPRICPMNLYDVSVSQLKEDRGLLKEQDGASLRRAKPATRSVKRAAKAKKKTINQAVQKKD